MNEQVSLTPEVRRLQPSCRLANGVRRFGDSLGERVRSTIGQSAFAPDGGLSDWRDALLPDTRPSSIEALPRLLDLRRLKQPHSGFVMLVNSFLPWQEHLDKLTLHDVSGFRELRFDARCPTGARGTPPHLDLLVINGKSIAAIKTHGVDYLMGRPRRLNEAYDGVQLTAGMEPWRELVRLIRNDRYRLRHVDGGALIRSAFGLSRTFPHHDIVLLYLFWEPTDAGSHQLFREQREELKGIARTVQNASVRFRAETYDALWMRWSKLNELPMLRTLVKRLRERYSLAIDLSAD